MEPVGAGTQGCVCVCLQRRHVELEIKNIYIYYMSAHMYLSYMSYDFMQNHIIPLVMYKVDSAVE